MTNNSKVKMENSTRNPPILVARKTSVLSGFPGTWSGNRPFAGHSPCIWITGEDLKTPLMGSWKCIEES